MLYFEYDFRYWFAKFADAGQEVSAKLDISIDVNDRSCVYDVLWSLSTPLSSSPITRQQLAVVAHSVAAGATFDTDLCAEISGVDLDTVSALRTVCTHTAGGGGVAVSTGDSCVWLRAHFVTDENLYSPYLVASNIEW